MTRSRTTSRAPSDQMVQAVLAVIEEKGVIEGLADHLIRAPPGKSRPHRPGGAYAQVEADAPPNAWAFPADDGSAPQVRVGLKETVDAGRLRSRLSYSWSCAALQSTDSLAVAALWRTRRSV